MAPWEVKLFWEKGLEILFGGLPLQGATSLMAQTVKHLPIMREAQVQSLGRGDLLEKEVAAHSSILAWKIPRTEEPSRL